MNFPHPTLVYEESGEGMEFDIYIPSMSTAFEYHGRQHFEEQDVMQGFSEIQRKDFEKKLKCKKYGIKLIEVPYTWNQTLDQLLEIIKKRDPSSPLLSKNKI